jgi:hypothetical protein
MKGYVALTTILILVPLLLLTGFNSVYRSLTTLLVGTMNYNYQILNIDTQTCLEESVYRIKRDHNLVGDIQINTEDITCDVNISNKVGFSGIKILEISAVGNNDVKVLLRKELDINVNPFELTNL